MNKTFIGSLVARFLESYDAPAKDKIWREHSVTFQRFWSSKVLAQGTGIIPDDECDVVIRILDRHGKGNTKKSEAVARTMVPQKVWRKLFNSLHTDPRLALLVDSVLKETNLERKADLINDLYVANKGRKNHLTGRTATTINALLAAYDPVNNLASVSLTHRKKQLDYLGLKLPFDWDQASHGQLVVQSNALLCKETRNLGIDGTARTLGAFWYSKPVKELWMSRETRRNRNGIDKNIRLTSSSEIHQLDYKIQTKAKIIKARKLEAQLLSDYQFWLLKQGRQLQSIKYGALQCDAYESGPRNLIEAKCSSNREYIRMAVGQLMDYSFQGRKRFGNPNLAILLPNEPSSDVFDWLESMNIKLVWREKKKFKDNANGLFV